MKYLMTMREYFEPDNNTPSDIIWARVVETDNMREAEEIYRTQANDEAYDVEITFTPLEDLEKDWERLEEIWQ